MLDHRTETFLKVCETMNFTAAANTLHMTQPAVSQHIRALEKSYGCRLFVYEQKQLRLTEEGKILLNAAKTMRNDDRALREKISSASVEAPHEYRIGATMTVGEHAIIKPISGFLTKNPDCLIELTVANTDELLEKLRRGLIHFAVIEGYFPAAEFEHEVFSTEKYIPVCAASHQFETEPESLKELTNQRLIMREKGSGTRDIMEKNLQAHGLRTESFSRRMEVSSLTAILGLVREDCGITFLYETAAGQEIRAGRLREIHLRDFVVEHDFTFIWNRGSIYSDEYRRICRLLRAESADRRGY